MNLKKLEESLKNAPVVKKGDYFYVIHPITDGIPEIEPDLLNEICTEIETRIKKIGNIDKIVTIEAMGIPIASYLSIKMNVPFSIIRKRSYGIPGEISVEQKTGYSKSKLYINGLNKNDNIVIVDDVLSTGGTLTSVLKALNKIGVRLKGVYIAVNKGKSIDKISKEFKVHIESLVDIEIHDGIVKTKTI